MPNPISTESGKVSLYGVRPAVQEGDLHEVYDHISDVMAAGVFTMNVPKTATGILVQAVTQNIRYVIGGGSPSATSGFVLTAGNDPLMIPLAPGTELKLIREADGAILQAQWVTY